MTITHRNTASSAALVQADRPAPSSAARFRTPSFATARATGFTMIEVMVVATILAILTALVYPSYAAQIVKTRRTEGQVALLDIIQQQERYFSQHNSYIAFSSDSTDPQEKNFQWWSGSSAARSAYELSAHACGDAPLSQCVELQAVPGTVKVDGRFADPDCQTLTLRSTGEHGASGPFPRCWP